MTTTDPAAVRDALGDFRAANDQALEAWRVFLVSLADDVVGRQTVLDFSREELLMAVEVYTRFVADPAHAETLQAVMTIPRVAGAKAAPAPPKTTRKSMIRDSQQRIVAVEETCSGG
jgi:hypothetical protein